MMTKIKWLYLLTGFLLFGGYAIGYRIDNLYFRCIGGILCLSRLFTVLRIPVCKTGTMNH
ncbi:MAG: hypothetical protein V3V05_02610 [Pontiella sp.]